jgi:hypothetical protein
MGTPLTGTLSLLCVGSRTSTPSLLIMACNVRAIALCGLVSAVLAANPPPGTRLEVQSCQGGSSTQMWTLGGDGTIRNTASGLCITAPGGHGGPGELVTDACGVPPTSGQVFEWSATGAIVLRGTMLTFNASYGSYNYVWVRPYAPLGLALPEGVSPSNASGLAPFQTFVVNSPSTGLIVANASLLSASVCVDAGFRVPLTLLSTVFGSSMVLQRDSNDTALYGWAPPGTTAVNVTMQQGDTRMASFAAAPNASASGAWRQVLPRTPASLSPYTITVVAVGSTAPPTVLTDVLFGDVYIIAGASPHDNCWVPVIHTTTAGCPVLCSSLGRYTLF